MKKLNIAKIIKYSVLSVFSFAVFSACEIGLGEAVDLEAPVVELTSHKDNDSVAQTFRLSGTAHDNEGVTKLSVDFEEADIHFEVEPGNKWKKKTPGSDWVEIAEENAVCVNKDGIWTWFVDVNAAEAKSGMGSNYSLEIIVSDAMGNSGKDSKINCSLIVDEKIPNVSIYKPDIITSYTQAANTFAAYTDINGNTFLNLLNGDITLYGRQEGSASFKELRIELDDGTADGSVISDNVPVIKNPTTELIAAEYPLGTAHKYFTKTLVKGEAEVTDLRNWQLTIVPEEWISDSHPELRTGKHLVRIISTSLSNSDAWERKVIGYFIWWPEADKPWIETNNGGINENGATEIFPSSPISGIAYDDDGISSFTYTIKKKNSNSNYEVFAGKENVAIQLSEENAKTSAWSLSAPDEEGIYELSLTISDLYGNSNAAEPFKRYYKTMDVKAPEISITTAADALADSSGNITFNGTVKDDGRISSLKVILLNPEDSSPTNMIRYLGGSEAFWDTNAVSDDYGNKKFAISLGSPLYDNSKKINTYTITNYSLNLFSDLGIGLETGKKHLNTLNFIFRAKDNGGTSTIYQVAVNGDTESPSLAITSIQQFKADGTAKTEELTDEIPNLAVVETGDYVILKGTMSDNSITRWNDRSKISAITFSWGSASFAAPTYSLNSDGSYSWQTTVTSIPTSSAPITARITDYGNNTTIVTKSVFIETTNVALERIGAITPDGYYSYYKVVTTDPSTETTEPIIIRLFLEFTKRTHVEGSPTLDLNLGPELNRKKATFVSSSNDSAQLEFDYTVEDGDNVTKLDVLKINGGTWSDASVAGSEPFTPTIPTDDNKKLGTSRNITIDTTKPTVSSIEALSAQNAYKTGSTILLRLNFSDDNLTIKNAGNMGLSFNDITSPTITARKSGSSVLFTYTVGASDNANPLTFTANSLTHSDVIITDEAENKLTDWSLAETEFTGIVIDNTPPVAPTITPVWTGDDVIVTDDTSFTITGEAEATVEYSLDNGSTWQSYTNTATNVTRTIQLKNNDRYQIKAKQTDKAGNQGPATSVKTVTVDKVELFKNITVTNAEATYKTGDTITGQINFGKAVALPSGATVSLNVKRNNAALPAISIANPTTAASTFTFTYVVDEKDDIDTTNNPNGLLKVSNWSFSTVDVNYGSAGSPVIKQVSLPYSSSITGKNISDSKEVKILAGYPEYQSYSLSSDNQTLTITFNRDISKISNASEIRLEMTDSYKAPAVLTESQYGKLPAAIKNATFTVSEVSKKYYTEGVNGANKPSETATTLIPDTTKKYILDYDIDDTNTNLTDIFKAQNKDKVIVPMYSSNVTASGRVLTVKLTGSYEIPVKGATYKLIIPSEIVQDEVQNKNQETNGSRTITNIVANGVEPPFIRIKKSDQVITSSGVAHTATVTMPDTAEMKISCQTPGAAITFAKKEEPSAQITIKDAKTHSKDDLTTPDVTIPTTLAAYSGVQTLGSAIANYNGASGLKIAIVASAAKGGATVTAYEYAARTVLKFNLDTGDGEYDKGGGYAAATTSETTSTNTVHLYNLPVWVQGGDAPAGGNTIAGFPISWDDCSTYKLMKCALHTATSTTNRYGGTDDSWEDDHTYWYWVTWDLSSVCYTGFAVGDVPADAATSAGKKGPKYWYVGECSWAAVKQNTALYPGETLELSLDGVDNNDDNNNTKGAYLFRTKNKGYRED